MPEITVAEARRVILDAIRPLGAERAFLDRAHGRVLADDLTAGRSIPPWDNSAMDGFAVRFADIDGASPDQPKTLRVLEDVPAGQIASQPVTAGAAIRIMTGAPVPDGADTVVPVELTRPASAGIDILEARARGSNVRAKGEDVAEGETVLPSGTLLTPAAIGLAASLGHATVRVFQRPRVAILSTGDEIAEVGTVAHAGQIYTSNSYTLMALCKDVGAMPTYLGIAADTEDDLRAHLQAALACDAIVTTGGVSVGDFDFVKKVLGELGSEMKFWKVAQRPGHPLAFGVIGGKPAFGLPGNPVSTMVSYFQYVRPSLLKMQGHTALFPPLVDAELEDDVSTRGGKLYFLRGVLSPRPGGGWSVSSTGAQGSGILTSMVRGNCLILIPPESTGAKRGDTVKVQAIDARIGWSADAGF